MTPFYYDDPELPYWRSRVDVYDVIAAHGHRPERAAAWLSQWDIENRHAVMMRGLFYQSLLNRCTYTFVFKPCAVGDLAIVLPILNDGRLVDLLAISRHGPRHWGCAFHIWGCVTGHGDHIGECTQSPLHVHRTAPEWLSNNCNGVLPLRRTFLPSLQAAPILVAADYEHACDLAERVYVEPAEQFKGDIDAAEKKANERIFICNH